MLAPSRADLLREGGIYPVVVPLGWKFVGGDGEESPIPAAPGHLWHRILARGPLVATEGKKSGQSQLMVLRNYALRGRITDAVVGQYSNLVTAALEKKGLGPRVDEVRIGVCALSAEPGAKVVVTRTAPGDDRAEVHYLVRDQKGQPWVLTYLIRQSEFLRWRPLLAEVDGPLLRQDAT